MKYNKETIEQDNNMARENKEPEANSNKAEVRQQNEKSGWCPYCQKNTPVERVGTKHIFHLFMSLCSCGLWFPVWLWFAFTEGGWICKYCGGKTDFHKIWLRIEYVLMSLMFLLWLYIYGSIFKVFFIDGVHV